MAAPIPVNRPTDVSGPQACGHTGQVQEPRYERGGLSQRIRSTLRRVDHAVLHRRLSGLASMMAGARWETLMAALMSCRAGRFADSRWAAEGFAPVLRVPNRAHAPGHIG